MRKAPLASCLLFVITLPVLAAKKIEGAMTLKDLQPFGSPDKEHKHQGYDLSFEAERKHYICRTDPKKSMDATEFVVGTQMNYKIDGNKAEIKTRDGKSVKCKIVRVEAIP